MNSLDPPKKPKFFPISLDHTDRSIEIVCVVLVGDSTAEQVDNKDGVNVDILLECNCDFDCLSRKNCLIYFISAYTSRQDSF